MAHLLDDADEWSSLDDVARDLRKYLNISNLKPLLREKRLLTDDEFEQVEISPANPTSQAIDKWVVYGIIILFDYIIDNKLIAR